MCVHTKFSMYTNSELVSMVVTGLDRSDLELELAQRLELVLDEFDAWDRVSQEGSDDGDNP